MPRFTVYGVVPEFTGREFSLPAHNWRELLAFWKREKIATRLDLKGGKPTVKVRGGFTAHCAPGSSVAYTIKTMDRSDGRRVRAVSVVCPAGGRARPPGTP